MDLSKGVPAACDASTEHTAVVVEIQHAPKLYINGASLSKQENSEFTFRNRNENTSHKERLQKSTPAMFT